MGTFKKSDVSAESNERIQPSFASRESRQPAQREPSLETGEGNRFQTSSEASQPGENFHIQRKSIGRGSGKYIQAPKELSAAYATVPKKLTIAIAKIKAAGSKTYFPASKTKDLATKYELIKKQVESTRDAGDVFTKLPKGESKEADLAGYLADQALKSVAEALGKGNSAIIKHNPKYITEPQRLEQTVVHEASHAAPAVSTEDVAYAYQRLFKYIKHIGAGKAAEANADSYGQAYGEALKQKLKPVNEKVEVTGAVGPYQKMYVDIVLGVVQQAAQNWGKIDLGGLLEWAVDAQDDMTLAPRGRVKVMVDAMTSADKVMKRYFGNDWNSSTAKRLDSFFQVAVDLAKPRRLFLELGDLAGKPTKVSRKADGSIYVDILKQTIPPPKGTDDIGAIALGLIRGHVFGGNDKLEDLFNVLFAYLDVIKARSLPIFKQVPVLKIFATRQYAEESKRESKQEYKQALPATSSKVKTSTKSKSSGVATKAPKQKTQGQTQTAPEDPFADLDLTKWMKP